MSLTAPRPSVDWTQAVKVPWGMMLNDTLSDCTIAGVGHLIMAWTANAQGTPKILTDAQVLTAYEQVDGYNPSDPSTDQGGVENDVLTAWTDNGIAGDKIIGSTDVGLGAVNRVEQMTAIDIFGGAYIGLNLPVTAQDQWNNEEPWDVVPNCGSAGNPGTWGGHAVPILAYTATGGIVVTWGELQQVTWAFMDQFCDEIHGILSPDWMNTASHLSPEGLDWQQLMVDLGAV